MVLKKRRLIHSRDDEWTRISATVSRRDDAKIRTIARQLGYTVHDWFRMMIQLEFVAPRIKPMADTWGRPHMDARRQPKRDLEPNSVRIRKKPNQ